MLIDFHLVCDVYQLGVDAVLLTKSCLVLNIELKTLVFKVVPFLHDDLKPIGESIVYKLVLKDFG